MNYYGVRQAVNATLHLTDTPALVGNKVMTAHGTYIGIVIESPTNPGEYRALYGERVWPLDGVFNSTPQASAALAAKHIDGLIHNEVMRRARDADIAKPSRKAYLFYEQQLLQELPVAADLEAWLTRD